MQPIRMYRCLYYRLFLVSLSTWIACLFLRIFGCVFFNGCQPLENLSLRLRKFCYVSLKGWFCIKAIGIDLFFFISFILHNWGVSIPNNRPLFFHRTWPSLPIQISKSPSDQIRNILFFSCCSSSAVSDEEIKAQDLIKNGQINEAIAIYQSLKPYSSRTLHLLGVLFTEKKGDYQSAINYYKQAIQMQEEVQKSDYIDNDF